MRLESARRALREASLELARLRRIRGASHRTWRRIARARKRLALAAALLAAAQAPEPAAAVDPHFRHGFIFVAEGVYSSLSIAPACGDIDGDGDLDVFLGMQSGNLLFIENTGTGGQPKFAEAVTNPFGLADVGSYAVPTVADLDGDGDLDVLVGASGPPSRTLYFQNTGTATAPAFGSPQTNAFGLAALFFDLADLDADGDLDAVSLGSMAPLFHENTGSATAPAFAAPAPGPPGLTQLGDTEFADVDGDGDLDAFVGTFGYDQVISLFENTGSASAPAFAAPVSNPSGLFGWSRGLSDFGDVDGDGDLDALVLGRYVDSSRVTAFENTGTATAPAFTPLGNPFGFGTPVTYSSWSAPEFADVDGDGDLDAFVSDYYTARTSFYRNTGSASTPAFSSEPALQLLGREPDLVDIDADGDLDAFVAVGTSTRFYRNTGTASSPALAAPVLNPFGLTNVPSTHHAAPDFVDIDGDGDIDALIGHTLGISFFRNTGTASAPAFAARLENPFGLTSVAYFLSPTFVDADGDGDLDAWVGDSPGRTVWFENTGTATAPAFAAPVFEPFGIVNVGFRSSPAFADIDADTDLDLFVGSGETRVYFFENVAVDPDACADGLDNDGDGLVDFGNDPGCASAADTSELGTTQCDNGLDDDGDGFVDAADPHCTGPLDDRELPNPPPGCGLGPELLLLAPLFAAVRRRRDSYTARKCPSASPTPRPTSSSSGAR